MIVALRAFFIGVALTTALHLWIDPPLGVLLIALAAGHALGIATAYWGDLVEWVVDWPWEGGAE